ncbi:MAG: HAD family hydrolase [Bacteroidales bacterium]
MKKQNLLAFIAIVSVLLACKPNANVSLNGADETLVLSSWQTNLQADTDSTISVNAIIAYIQKITDSNSKAFIPVEDRVAVFDMDGTIACERPFSFEQVCSSQLAFGTIPSCNANKDSLQDAIIKKFKSYLPCNITSDSLIRFFAAQTAMLKNQCIPVNNPKAQVLCKQFYKPMIELIRYLQANQFEVYIVSGSSQQFIRGIVSNVDPLCKLHPSHIIGSLQQYQKLVHTDGIGGEFYLDTANFLSNVSQGKAINIYNRIGKQPVFAFGNTVDDFDMFSITSYKNKYSTMCVLLNHDSKDMEDAYFPFKSKNTVTKNWNQPSYSGKPWSTEIFWQIVRNEGWKVANMSQCFNPDSVFIGD